MHFALWILSIVCVVTGRGEAIAGDEALRLSFQNWQASGQPSVHPFTDAATELYRDYPTHAHSNSMMGAIAFAQFDMLSAALHFRTACEFTLFMEGNFIRNYIQAQNSLNYVETIEVLTLALEVDIYNEVLCEEMVTMLNKLSRDNNLPVLPVVRLLTRLPMIHDFWLIFARMILSKGNNIHEVDGVDGLSLVQLSHFTIYGLSMFPRSSDLLLLQATLYSHQNRPECAAQLLATAQSYAHLSSKAFDSAPYFEQLKDALSEGQPRARSEFSCLPQLLQHEAATYQQIHHAITHVIGTDWTNISQHSRVPQHVFYPSIVASSITTVTTVDSATGSTTTTYLPALQVGCANPLKCARPGFIVVDAVESINTHFVSLAYDLSMIDTSSVGLLYSSHTLEHLSYNLPPPSCATYPVSSRTGDKSCYNELDATLAEWRRVVVTGGTLLLSVPDLVRLMTYFLDPAATRAEKSILLSIIYGGQRDQFDSHKTGFYWEILDERLRSHGFCDVARVEGFGLFFDTSATDFRENATMSLNVRAVACAE